VLGSLCAAGNAVRFPEWDRVSSRAAGPFQLSISHSQILPAARRAHDELLTHRDLQFDFPAFHPPVTPQWLVDLGNFLARIWPHLWFLGYLGWAAIIGAALIVLILIGRGILRSGWLRGRLDPNSEAVADWRPGTEAARNLLREADALAAQGKFAEAVHLILLRSIEHINEQNPNLVKPAMTSREIGALRQLPAAARTAFVAITRVVERALFAGLEIVASDFARCRETYERFAFPWAKAPS
jgi:hypothetical protein